MSEPTRRYRSARRAEQTAETRRDILAAARRLFSTAGYNATSVDRLATEAGVAVQTIYAAYGSKIGLLAALHRHIEDEVLATDVPNRMRRVAEPGELVDLAANVSRQLNERCGDIMRAVYFAANADQAAAGIWAEGMQRHRRGTAHFARRLEALGALSPGLDEARAADVVDFLTSPQSYFHLVGDLGWSFDECEAWIADTMRRLLLPEPPGVDSLPH